MTFKPVAPVVQKKCTTENYVSQVSQIADYIITQRPTDKHIRYNGWLTKEEANLLMEATKATGGENI